MPDLKSWGIGGYRRSSLAKRIRDILNMGTEPPDSLGVDRVGDIKVPLPGSLWKYGPEGPRVSPLLNYHHQYSFTVADDVSTFTTWDETRQGGGKPLTLVGSPDPSSPLYPQIFGNFETGNNAGDYAQYQEKNFSFYAEEETAHDLWFKADIVDTPPGSGAIYIGLTPTNDNAIVDRDYGYGFTYDPVEDEWAFQIDNIIDGITTKHRFPLEGGTPATVAFKVEWPTRSFDPDLWSRGHIDLRWNVPYVDQYEMKIGLSSDMYILDRSLRLTFGAENLISAKMRLGLGTLKEIFQKQINLPAT